MDRNTLIRTRAQELRKNATKEENHLWYDFLRRYPVQFNRQKPFGPYIVDFYCDKAKLAVELDGSQHYQDEGPDYDRKRSRYLERECGLLVLRFTNLDIQQNFEGVCEVLDRTVKERIPSSAAADAASASPRGSQIKKPSPPGKVPPEGADEGTVPDHPQKEHPMKQVTIYTDGACSGNPGPGGWGAILMYGPHKKEMSGGEKQTTNNRMELTGVITALEALKEPCVVELWSDSKYVIDGLGKGWAKGWRARGWVKSDKKPALNPDLWGKLLDLCDYHTVHLHWVKGHAENPYNNRCDELAVAESQKYKG